MLVLGLVQGIAEFLPISSSGHLVLFQHFSWFKNLTGGYSENLNIIISVLLHIATLIGILIYLRKDIINLLKGVYNDIINKNFNGGDIKALKNIIITTIPAGITGVLFNDFFESLFSSPVTVFFMLIINGIILISTKRIRLKSRKLDEIGLWSALFTGLFQAVAIIPGISRSGMTITGGMISGLAPEESARFSFLMAIPVIAGAGLLESIKAAKTGIPGDLAVPLLISMAFTVIISLVALRVLFAVVKRVKLDLFGYYTILAGILGLIFY
jgi:undecaprenyl-diphosphatase